MDVTWRFEPTDGACRVSIEHDFRPRMPLWAAFVDRAFTRPIATRTLASFKAIAEALADDELPG
jgi:ribosome-associated toxin RatA of RatAB toxin-antitoxin module